MSEPVTLNPNGPHSTVPPQSSRPAAGNGSTGPRTESGKKRSSQNSLKHGLTGSDLHIDEDEQEEFDEFKASLLQETQPHGPIQMVLFNALLLASWSLLRVGRMEAGYMARGPEALMDPETRKALELLNRYQARHERSMYRARRELEQLQTAEIVRQLLPPEVDAATPPLADPMKIHIAKRSADKAWLEEEQFWMTLVRPPVVSYEVYRSGVRNGPEAKVRQ